MMFKVKPLKKGHLQSSDIPQVAELLRVRSCLPWCVDSVEVDRHEKENRLLGYRFRLRGPNQTDWIVLNYGTTFEAWTVRSHVNPDLSSIQRNRYPSATEALAAVDQAVLSPLEYLVCRTAKAKAKAKKNPAIQLNEQTKRMMESNPLIRENWKEIFTVKTLFQWEGELEYADNLRLLARSGDRSYDLSIVLRRDHFAVAGLWRGEDNEALHQLLNYKAKKLQTVLTTAEKALVDPLEYIALATKAGR